MSQSGHNFIRYRIGSGHLTLHAAPLVLSNYFLVQGRNRDYLGYIWKTLPEDISTIYWHDYYKRNAESSDLGVMFRFSATRWALLLALFTLLLFRSRTWFRYPLLLLPQCRTRPGHYRFLPRYRRAPRLSYRQPAKR